MEAEASLLSPRKTEAEDWTGTGKGGSEGIEGENGREMSKVFCLNCRVNWEFPTSGFVFLKPRSFGMRERERQKGSPSSSGILG